MVKDEQTLKHMMPHRNISNFIPSGVQLDTTQLNILKQLQEARGWLEPKSLFSLFNKNHQKGVYLWGGVGRGKTMIMRAFYDFIKSPKQIVHYQDFMQLIHRNIHLLQGATTDKIIAKLAKKYANKAKIICLDEFEIKDIADAMIISRLFQEFINNKVFIFITTNTSPENLYKDGLQRELFLPFIGLIQQNFLILHLDASYDYRLDKATSIHKRIWFPLDETTNQEIKKIISELTDDNLFHGQVEVFGRQIDFAKTYKTTLITDFNELIKRDLGYIDYVHICKRFTTIVLENIPVISASDTDTAIRFINFIDNAYFCKVLLFVTMQDKPELIYPKGKREEEFNRTVSRLHEMNSDLYLEEINE